MRDLHSNIGVVQAITPQVVNSGGGPVASGVLDLIGFNSAEFVVGFGSSGEPLTPMVKFDVTLEHADDDEANPGTVGVYANVDASDVLGAVPTDGVVLTVDSVEKSDRAYRVGYIGYRRFLRVTITPSAGNANGTPVSVQLVKGHPSIAPVP